MRDGNHKLMVIVGFVVLGLTPSFIDWMQSPEYRHWMVASYLVGIVLVWNGLGE